MDKNKCQRLDTSSAQTRTPEQYLGGLITTMWERWFTFWEDRNLELHGRDTQTKRSHLGEEVNCQLNAIYAQKSFMDPRVQSLLLETPIAHASQSLQVTQNLLHLNTPIFKANVQKVRRLALQGMQSIQTFFSPVPSCSTVQ
jgi:hypothetical protein